MALDDSNVGAGMWMEIRVLLSDADVPWIVSAFVIVSVSGPPAKPSADRWLDMGLSDLLATLPPAGSRHLSTQSTRSADGDALLGGDDVGSADEDP